MPASQEQSVPTFVHSEHSFDNFHLVSGNPDVTLDDCCCSSCGGAECDETPVPPAAGSMSRTADVGAGAAVEDADDDGGDDDDGNGDALSCATAAIVSPSTDADDAVRVSSNASSSIRIGERTFLLATERKHLVRILGFCARMGSSIIRRVVVFFSDRGLWFGGSVANINETASCVGE